ncbi:MAG: response regulator transcription factor [Bacteroidota bacterium]
MKILLADPHTMVRQGIAKLLSKAYPFAKIREVADSDELFKLIHRESWDIVITEICMQPCNSGLAIIKKIKDVNPASRVLVLSIYDVEQFAVRAMKAGAFGYLSKEVCFSEIVVAINRILTGKKYITAELGNLLADCIAIGQHDSAENLSDREFQVLQLLGKGYSVSDVANQIIVSHNTVSTFRSRIFEKMGFKNNLELIRYAVDHRLSE